MILKLLHKRRLLASLLILILSCLSNGCVNLDKRDPAPLRLGQKTDADRTYATSGDTKKSVKKMQNFSKSSSGFKRALQDAWPFQRKAKMTVQQQGLAKDDPTRLDNMPENMGPDFYLAAARVAEQSGAYKQAIKQYEAALSAAADNRNAMIGLARLKHKLGRTQDAIDIYQRALVAHQEDPVILNDLGICYASLNRLNESIECLSTAVEKAPDREMYLNNLAASLVDANRIDDAKKKLYQHRAPEVANFNLGYLLAQTGRHEEAVASLQQALFMNPELHPARQLLDELNQQQGRKLQVAGRPETTN